MWGVPVYIDRRACKQFELLSLLRQSTTLEDVELITVSYKHLQHLFANSPAWERFGRIATENLCVASRPFNDYNLGYRTSPCTNH